MWKKGWRDQAWADLEQPWDIIIIGGGITGAGIFREATAGGMRVLLAEEHDFSSGTSSRSSKLVHGGLRYLKNAQIKVTYEAVRERELFMRQGRGLVNQLGFLLTCYKGDSIPPWVFRIGLIIYDILAMKWGHRYYDSYDMKELSPMLSEEGLRGGFRYFDAQTDDSRLVLRLIQEGAADGGTALNYSKVRDLLRDRTGRVCGVALEDMSGGGRTAEVKAKVVINAAGAWADDLREKIGAERRLRRLRGSHLVLPYSRLPLTRAVSFIHPKDGRPVFAFPWEGTTLVGTTDLDYVGPMRTDTSITSEEVEYLLDGMRRFFPEQELVEQDIRCTFSGIRPVVDTGKKNPSKESREHVLWRESGLLTVTGGKLTTFRLMALGALKATRLFPGKPLREKNVFNAPPEWLEIDGIKPASRRRLLGRYGDNTPDLVESAMDGEIAPIGDSAFLWAELRWAARSEAVLHLDDLLLRRVRIGLLLPDGGLPWMDRVRSIVQPELGWDDAKWESELDTYTNLWKKYYFLPDN